MAMTRRPEGRRSPGPEADSGSTRWSGAWTPSRRRRTETAPCGAWAAKVLPPLVAVGWSLLVWQVLTGGDQAAVRLPSAGATCGDLSEQWRRARCSAGDLDSLSARRARASSPRGHRHPARAAGGPGEVVRAAIGPILSGLQSLPSVAWVPAGDHLVRADRRDDVRVILLGAVPSIANGLISGIDQVPPLFLRVGRVLGARGLTGGRHIVMPAALPGYLAGLKQGWAFPPAPCWPPTRSSSSRRRGGGGEATWISVAS